MANWQGINQGLRTGLAFMDSMAQREQQRELADRASAERADERAYQRGRDAKADARAQAQTDLAMAGEFDKQTQRLAAAGLQGLPVDPAQLEASAARGKKARQSAYKAMGYEDMQAEASAVLKRLDAGTGIEQLTAPELGALSYSLKRPITDFIDRPDRPAPVSLAFSAFADAAEKGDMETMLAAGNELLRSDIEDGIGGRNAKGDVIVDKVLSSIDMQGETARGNLIVRARREDGTEYDYEAPLTEGRVPGGKPKAIDLDAVMDRISKTGELLEAINSDPQRAQTIAGTAAEWEKAGGREQFNKFYQAYIAAGGDPKALRSKVETKTVNRGGYDEDITTDESGRVVSTRRVERTAAPEAPGTAALRKAQADYYRGRGAGLGAAGAGGLYIANTETGEVVPYDGGEIPPGFSPPFKAGTKAQAIGPGQRREQAEKILEEMSKDYRAKVQAAGALGTAGPAPTIQDAIAELDRREKAFAPPAPPVPPPAPRGAADPAARQTAVPLRTQGAQPIPDGATAVNPKTGQRIQRVNGQWRPVQ